LNQKRKMKKNYSLIGKKKGNAVIEGLTVLVLITVFAIGGIWGMRIFDDLNSDIQADDSMDTQAQEVSDSLYTKYPTLIDNLFLFMFVMFIIFVLVSAFLIDSHPIFFIISAILLLAIFVAAIFVGNAYNEIATDPEVSDYANAMPYMSFVMRHIVEMIIGIGFMTSIVMFIKIRG